MKLYQEGENGIIIEIFEITVISRKACISENEGVFQIKYRNFFLWPISRYAAIQAQMTLYKQSEIMKTLAEWKRATL